MLHDEYPRSLTVGHAVYHFKAPFDTVLFLQTVLTDGELTPDDKTRLLVRLIFGPRLWTMKRRRAVLDAFMKLLSPDEHAHKSERHFDFEQDEALIRDAFMQQYGIDLDRERGHLSWWRFIDLLGGITADTAFGKVIEIRTAKVPEPTKYNGEMRRKLLEQKARVALKHKEGACGEARFMASMAALADRMIAQNKAGGK